MNNFQHSKNLDDVTETSQSNEYSKGYVSGFRQALTAIQRANKAGIPIETALSKLNSHQLQLIQWRNAALKGETPPKFNLW